MAAPSTFSDFLAKHHGVLTEEVLRRFPPYYTFEAGVRYAEAAAGLRRRLFPAQFHAAAALTDYLREARAAVLVGEPSVGKTITSLAAGAFLDAARVLVVAPAHLIAKWQREILGTIPGARCVELHRISDIGPAVSRYAAANWPLFCLLSRDRAKLGAPWRVAVQPAYLLKLPKGAPPGALPQPVPFADGALKLPGLLRDDAGEPVLGYRCHSCGTLLADVPTAEELEKGEEPRLWTAEDLRDRRACPQCRGALWSYTPLRGGRGLYPIARYVARRHPEAFDLLVIDECFPAGTPVATPAGAISIDRVRPGDEVLSYTRGAVVARRVVRRIRRRLTHSLVRVIHRRGTFVCTANHKIWTDRGYIPAADLEPGDTLVSLENTDAEDHQDLHDLRGELRVLEAPAPRAAYLQSAVRQSAAESVVSANAQAAHTAPTCLRPLWEALPWGEANTPVLLEALLRVRSLVRSRIPGPHQRRIVETEPSAPPVGLGAHEAHEPRPAISGKERRSQARASVQGTPRRQWPAHTVSASSARDDRLALRVLGRSTSSGTTTSRDSRSGASGTADGRRMRWAVPPGAAAAITGSAQRGHPPRPGLDRSPLSKHRDRSQSESNSGTDLVCGHSTVLATYPVPAASTDYVYDLEVADTHCYFAAGVLVSNCHQYKARGSGQGMALADLTRAAQRTLALTGTLMSGKASSLFYLLHRISPSFRRSWAYGDAGRFTRTFGLAEISKEPFEEVTISKTGKQTRRQLTRTTTRELPGVSPAILGSVLDRAAFIHLSDLGIQLPPYREHALEVPLAPAQAEPYREFFSDLRGAIAAGYHRRNLRLLGGYLQALLSWPDAPWRGDTLTDPSSGEVLAAIAALDAEAIYPKEQALIELCRREQAAGRRVLVYCTHTKSRDITARLSELLTGAGLRATVLSTAVGPHGREAWIRRRAPGLDALVTSPRLVGEGLDLVEFPTVVWMEPEYSTYIVRQASRRTWRLTQREPVDVHFMVYEGTLQQQALSLVARGIRAASMVDGEVLPEETLASDYGQAEFFLSLAKMVVDRTAVHDLGASLAEASTRAAADATFLGGPPGPALPVGDVPAPISIRDRQIAVTRGEQLPLF